MINESGNMTDLDLLSDVRRAGWFSRNGIWTNKDGVRINSLTEVISILLTDGQHKRMRCANQERIIAKLNSTVIRLAVLNAITILALIAALLR